MKSIIKKHLYFFANTTLKTKITTITIFVATITTFSSFIGFTIVQHSNNNLLYKTVAGSLSNSADTISNTLSDVESLSKTIISNQYIRTGLISLEDDPYSSIHTSNVTNTVTQLITENHRTIPELSYITLKNKYTVSTSYEPASSRTNQKITDSVIYKSSQTAGYPNWVTDYCNEEGLFLCRSCLRIQNLEQQNLGTLILNVNFDKLIKKATKSILYGDKVQYIVYQNGIEIYHTDKMTKANSAYLRKHLNTDYKIIPIEKHNFFCVKGTIASTEWEYICLIPYTDIARQKLISILLASSLIITSVLLALYTAEKYSKLITHDFNELIIKMKNFGSNTKVTLNINQHYSNRTDEIGVLHHQFDEMTIEIENLINKNYVNELLKKDAQLQSLQSQINPHFLYNALDSVNWRAKAIGEASISEMVESLGTLLRATLSQKKNLISVKEDLDIVHNYITIQKIRFDEERLAYKENLGKDLLDALIPQMSIQPLVDNAINYALDYIVDQCIIEVTGYLDKENIHILVTNNGSQFEANLLDKLRNGTIKPHGTGIGLINIDKRIKLIFGEPYGLVLYNPDDDHATAEIFFPRRSPC